MDNIHDSSFCHDGCPVALSLPCCCTHLAPHLPHQSRISRHQQCPSPAPSWPQCRQRASHLFSERLPMWLLVALPCQSALPLWPGRVWRIWYDVKPQFAGRFLLGGLARVSIYYRIDDALLYAKSSTNMCLCLLVFATGLLVLRASFCPRLYFRGFRAYWWPAEAPLHGINLHSSASHLQWHHNSGRSECWQLPRLLPVCCLLSPWACMCSQLGSCKQNRTSCPSYLSIIRMCVFK